VITDPDRLVTRVYFGSLVLGRAQRRWDRRAGTGWGLRVPAVSSASAAVSCHRRLRCRGRGAP